MTDNAIQVDYALAMEHGVGSGGGLSDAELDAEAPVVAESVRSLRGRVGQGELGFWALPTDASMLARVKEVAAGRPEGVRDVLLLGIGGSSLGARALCQALLGPTEAPPVASQQGLRLHLPDNSDPWLLATLLDRLDPAATLAVVVSKSGGTVETAAQWTVVSPWFEQALGREHSARHVVVITDPEKGPLRELATARGFATLPVPANVGGRFSVLSPVGLLPAVLTGLDVDGLLRGAAMMAERCDSEQLHENPAAVLAAVHVLQHRLRGRSIHVLMPYADRLRAFAAWYVQLWAESLGKRCDRSGRAVESGPTPLPAVGATDQHAQVQLFMQGPRDKLVTFVQVGEPERDLMLAGAQGAFAYLNGTSLGQLLDAEREGTTQALANDGRPSITVRMPRVDAEQVGALLFLYEAATALAGELYAVNPFDQPGVELGKRLAFGLLGRAGYEQAGNEIRKAIAARPTRFRA